MSLHGPSRPPLSPPAPPPAPPPSSSRTRSRCRCTDPQRHLTPLASRLRGNDGRGHAVGATRTTVTGRPFPVVPAQAGPSVVARTVIGISRRWVPAFAGTTGDRPAPTPRRHRDPHSLRRCGRRRERQHVPARECAGLDLEAVVAIAVLQRLDAIAPHRQRARLPLPQHVEVLVQDEFGIGDEAPVRSGQIDHAAARRRCHAAAVQSREPRALDDADAIDRVRRTSRIAASASRIVRGRTRTSAMPSLARITGTPGCR